MNAAVPVLRGAIRLYQWFVSPLLGAPCRHWPSCSHYAVEALETHGALRGSWLAFTRVLRCNPWGTSGVDPVPASYKHIQIKEAEHRHG
jgi:putative membrane protein insertion efficiency factor